MAPKKSTIVLNVEQFIHDIEERPAIWNRNFHCNKAFLEQMWDELSAVYKLPKIVLKAKWKGLRDNFRVEYKRIPRADNGDFLVEPATFESKWIHYYALLFLTDHMRHRLPKNEQDQSFYFTQQSQDCEKTVVEPDLTNGLIRRMQDSDEDFDEDDMAEDDYDDEMTDTSPPPQATVPPPSALPPPPPLTPQLPQQQQQQQQQLQPPPRQLTPPAAHQSLSTVSASLKPDDAQTLLKAGLLRAHQAALLELEKEAQDLSKKSTTYTASGVVATSTPIKDIATTTTPLMMTTTTTVTPNTTPPPMLSATSCSNSSSSTALMMATTTNSTVAATLSQLISNSNNNNNNNAGQSAVALSATQTPVQLTTTPTPPTAAHKKRSVSPPPLYNKAHHPPPNVGNQASAVVHSAHCKERDDYPLNGNAGNVNNVSSGSVGGVVSAVTCLHGSHEHLNFTKHSYANGLIPALKLKRQRLSEDSNFNGSSTMDTTTAAPLVPEDDDYHYLLSLHPYMKQLTAAQKLRIRTKIQKLIFKELYKEDLEETK